MSLRHLTSTSVLVAVALTSAGLAFSVTTSSAATLDDGLVLHHADANDHVRLSDDVLRALADATVSAQVGHVAGGLRTITCTLGSGTAIFYEDGVEVARRTRVTTTADTIATCLRRSADGYLQGEVRDFRLYDRALSPGEARELGKVTASARPAADVAALDLGATSAVTDDLTLPAKALGGSVISWESSAPSVVSATGAVTRPAARAGDSRVTLTATASHAGYTATREFTVTVLEDLTDRQKVDDALKDVVIRDEVRGDLALPSGGAHGVTFTWQSSDPGVVTTSGEVTRPPHGSRPRVARISVRAAKGYTYNTRYFTLTVLPLPKKAAMEGYLAARVTGEAAQEVHFAISGSDPSRWEETNGGRPVLRSKYAVRDPFIIRSEEGDSFSLVAMRQDGSHLEIWESTDLVTWSEQRHVPVSAGTPRFGTELAVSKAELDRVRQGPPPLRAGKKGVLADYDLTGGVGAAVADLSGNARTATIRGDVSRSPAGLVFGGEDGYLQLPEDLAAGLGAMTVSAQVWVDPAQRTPFSLWDTGDAVSALPRGNWHTVTCTLSNGTARLFDGPVEFARMDGVTVGLREFGRSFHGKTRRLTVWNRVLTEQEIRAFR
ncbi:immunoglobulin-like domain-containing protein [Lentzea sp. NPDC005914]|uniref:immunoglobulin-like domain-containing protein n=1 Tax=Lentzea sp. NPDC005914 TaxID=3154572 RepID=UPI0033D9640C